MSTRRLAWLAAAMTLAMAGCTAEAPEQALPPADPPADPAAEAVDYATIVAGPDRTAADLAADPLRKPVDMLQFAGVRPGMAVFEMLPGGGYFTRLFSAAVGQSGQLTLYVPEEMVARKWAPLESAKTLQGTMAGQPVSVASYPLAGPVPGDLAERFDVVWTSRNYHDFHNVPGFDARAANAMVMDLLKPGGVYVVLDHSAPDGSGTTATNTTHRIDADLVRREVESAGFLYDGASAVLKNPADDRTSGVYDGPLKGRTDQFVMRFRKPG